MGLDPPHRRRRRRPSPVAYIVVVVALLGCNSVVDDERPQFTITPATITETDISIETQPIQDALSTFQGYRAPYHAFAGPKGTAVSRNQPTRSYTAIVLENQFVRVTVLPEAGGRIYAFENRATGNNAFYENPEGFKVNPWGRFGWWMAAGGTEIMFPWDEHGGPFYLPFDDLSDRTPWEVIDGPEGVTFHMAFDESEYSNTDRWRLEVQVHVPDGKALHTVTYRFLNESVGSEPLMAWSNTMVAPGKYNMMAPQGLSDGTYVDHQVSFKQNVDRLYNHNDNLGEQFWGQPWDLVSWPVHRGTPSGDSQPASIDVSLLRNWYEQDLKFAGLFVPETVSAEQSSTFIGQYNRRNTENGEGIVKVVPATIAGRPVGLKYWHWGSFSMAASAEFAEGRSTYAELMAGPVRVFQDPVTDPVSTGTHPTGEPYSITVAPGETVSWTETYLIPWGIGGITEADERGVLYARKGPTQGEGCSVTVGVYPVTHYRSAALSYFVDGVLKERLETGAIGPGENPGPFLETRNLPSVDSSSEIRVEVTFADGTELSAEAR